MRCAQTENRHLWVHLGTSLSNFYDKYMRRATNVEMVGGLFIQRMTCSCSKLESGRSYAFIHSWLWGYFLEWAKVGKA